MFLAAINTFLMHLRDLEPIFADKRFLRVLSGNAESGRGPLDSITIPTLIRFLLKLWAAQLIIALGVFLIVAVLALLARAFGLLPMS